MPTPVEVVPKTEAKVETPPPETKVETPPPPAPKVEAKTEAPPPEPKVGELRPQQKAGRRKGSQSSPRS